MRSRLLRFFGALTLALVVLAVNFGVLNLAGPASSARAASAWAETTASAALDLSVLPASDLKTPRVNQPAPAVPDGCWQYDSWCHYCARNPGSSVCKKNPPTLHP